MGLDGDALGLGAFLAEMDFLLHVADDLREVHGGRALRAVLAKHLQVLYLQ
jgi:hypothetical protein